MKIKLFSFLTLVTGLITVSSSLSCGAKKEPDNNLSTKAPNIIFYLSDDQNIEDYGCYGNDKVHTPAVDQLAKEGMLFTNAFTGQAICAPSRTQLYTGNYPLKNGMFLNHITAKDNQKSVTQYMSELGYEVVLAGKSHVKPKTLFDWDKEYRPEKIAGSPRKMIPLSSIKEYFETHNKPTDKPFCMFITSEYPHPPFFPYDGKKEKEDFKYLPYSEGKSVKAMAGYYRNIEEDNTQLEKVLTWIDDNNLKNNSVFIYSADHGHYGKFTVYDTGLHVPFIVRWPNVIKPGSSSDVMIHYTDVLPTFMNVAGGKSPKEIDGQSFMTALKGDSKEIHKYVYGVRHNQNIQQAAVFPSRMVRSKKYKYIRNFNSIEVVEKNYTSNEAINQFLKRGAEKFKDIPFEELFDLEKDPFELVNLAKDPEYKGIKEELTTEMYSWMKDQGDFLLADNYMPLLKPSMHYLDQSSRFKKVPEKLENTIKEDDYLKLHY